MAHFLEKKIVHTYGKLTLEPNLLTVHSKYMFCIKCCLWLHLNCGPLVLGATVLPIEPQPLLI